MLKSFGSIYLIFWMLWLSLLVTVDMDRPNSSFQPNSTAFICGTDDIELICVFFFTRKHGEKNALPLKRNTNLESSLTEWYPNIFLKLFLVSKATSKTIFFFKKVIIKRDVVCFWERVTGWIRDLELLGKNYWDDCSVPRVTPRVKTKNKWHGRTLQKINCYAIQVRNLLRCSKETVQIYHYITQTNTIIIMFAMLAAVAIVSLYTSFARIISCFE